MKIYDERFPTTTKITYHVEWSDASGNWAQVSIDFLTRNFAETFLLS